MQSGPPPSGPDFGYDPRPGVPATPRPPAAAPPARVPLNVVPQSAPSPQPRPTPPTGAVVGIGLAMTLGVLIFGASVFTLSTQSLLSTSDGATLANDAQSTLMLSFLMFGGGLALFFVARKNVEPVGWAIAAPVGGAIVAFLTLGALQQGARELATAPVWNGRAQVALPYFTAGAIMMMAGIGATVTAAVRGWRVAGAAPWIASGLLVAVGLSGALFST